MIVQIALELGIEMAVHKQDHGAKVHNFVPICIIITPCTCMHSRGIVFCCQFVCLFESLSVCPLFFWAVCTFEEHSRARLNPDR